MVKRAIGIALAFIGLVVGAGFASGQEISQYFVAFGLSGIWPRLNSEATFRLRNTGLC